MGFFVDINHWVQIESFKQGQHMMSTIEVLTYSVNADDQRRNVHVAWCDFTQGPFMLGFLSV